MPHDLPHWSTVYHYFRQWQKEGVWEKAVQDLVRRDREREGRPASPSALVMDSHKKSFRSLPSGKSTRLAKRLSERPRL
jgi:transposase